MWRRLSTEASFAHASRLGLRLVVEGNAPSSPHAYRSVLSGFSIELPGTLYPRSQSPDASCGREAFIIAQVEGAGSVQIGEHLAYRAGEGREGAGVADLAQLEDLDPGRRSGFANPWRANNCGSIYASVYYSMSNRGPAQLHRCVHQDTESLPLPLQLPL